MCYITVINDGLGQLRDVTESANSLIQNFTNSAVGSGGYIDEGRDIAQTGFDFVRQYDTPRYIHIAHLNTVTVTTL